MSTSAAMPTKEAVAPTMKEGVGPFSSRDEIGCMLGDRGTTSRPYSSPRSSCGSAFWYPMSKKRVDENVAILAERHAAAAAAAGGESPSTSPQP